MNKILFGSTLIKKLFPDFRTPNDIDWIVFDPDESKRTDTGSCIEEFHYLPLAPRNREMNPDELYTLKVSHATRDIHWSKTMSDIRFFQMKQCKIIPSFLSELRDYWNTVHGPNKRTTFTANDFFKDNVKRKLEHDAVHKLLNPIPSYLKIVGSDNGVAPLESKFFGLSNDCERNEVAFEEAFVIGLERYLDLPERKAYHIAQRSLVTRLHPLWIADYIILNWNLVFWDAGNAGSLFEKYKELREELKRL